MIASSALLRRPLVPKREKQKQNKKKKQRGFEQLLGNNSKTREFAAFPGYSCRPIFGFLDFICLYMKKSTDEIS